MKLGPAVPLLASISRCDERTLEITFAQEETHLIDGKHRLLRSMHHRAWGVQARIHEVLQPVRNVIQDRFRP
jgi:hypothetical protein